MLSACTIGMNEKPTCPKCKSAHVIKSGKVQGKQRVKCKSCSFQFTKLTPRGRPANEKAMAITLYTIGLSIHAIAKLFDVSPTSILRWIKTFAKQHYDKPEPGDAILIELDEMWHYLKQKNKLWIWKAYRRETGELIDWECGGRDKQTLSKMLKRLSKWNVELYCSDNWSAYSELIDEELLYQSKSQTVNIEQNNGRQRRWFARFRRKSIVVSKTLEMVDLTMAISAKFHVNGTWKDIAALFG